MTQILPLSGVTGSAKQLSFPPNAIHVIEVNAEGPQAPGPRPNQGSCPMPSHRRNAEGNIAAAAIFARTHGRAPGRG